MSQNFPHIDNVRATERIGGMKMRTSIFVILTILLLGLVGCERAADITSPVKYEKDNISFSHPQNWKVTEDVAQQDVRYLFVESPGYAIFVVQIYAKHDAVSFSEFVEWFSSQSKEETPIGNISESSFSYIEETTFSPSIREGFSITVLGQKIPHIRKYYVKESSKKVTFLVAQVAVEDLGKVEPGFNLILRSFVVE